MASVGLEKLLKYLQSALLLAAVVREGHARGAHERCGRRRRVFPVTATATAACPARAPRRPVAVPRAVRRVAAPVDHRRQRRRLR